MTAPPPVVTVWDDFGNVLCQWECPIELWIDIQTFTQATGQTVDQLIDRALTTYFYGLQARAVDPRRV